MSDAPSLIDFVRSYREPTATAYVAQELERLGKLGTEWPRASAGEWTRQLRMLVLDGKLSESDGVLSIPKQVKQGQLF
jgi:hypothetical protein